MAVWKSFVSLWKALEVTNRNIRVIPDHLNTFILVLQNSTGMSLACIVKLVVLSPLCLGRSLLGWLCCCLDLGVCFLFTGFFNWWHSLHSVLEPQRKAAGRRKAEWNRGPVPSREFCFTPENFSYLSYHCWGWFGNIFVTFFFSILLWISYLWLGHLSVRVLG